MTQSRGAEGRTEKEETEAPFPLFSVVRPIVEPPCDLFCFHTVDKGFGVHFPDAVNGMLGLFCGNHRVQKMLFLTFITAHTPEMGGVVVGFVPDSLVYLVGMVSDNQQRLFLIPFIEHMENLGGGKLEDDGVQGFFPAEEQSGHHQHGHISHENIVPGINSLALGEENGDKIGAAAGGVCEQAQADGAAVDNAAENADEQRVRGNFQTGEEVGQNTGKDDHQTGISGKFFADVAEADDSWYRV